MILLNKYNATRMWSTGAYDYMIKYDNNKYMITLKYDKNNMIESIIVNMIAHIESMVGDTLIPMGEGDKLFESLIKDLTKRGIELKINGNTIDMENILNLI